MRISEVKVKKLCFETETVSTEDTKHKDDTEIPGKGKLAVTVCALVAVYIRKNLFPVSK